MHPDQKNEMNNHGKGTDVIRDTSINLILAYSYLLYFTALLLGIIFDSIFPHKLFANPVIVPIGFILIILASFLIFWAQRTSRHFKKDAQEKENPTKEIFLSGPYSFTRMPTYLGLFLLILGFGIIVNATFVILFSILAFLVSKLLFSRREESILADKYGTPYIEYKKAVRF